MFTKTDFKNTLFSGLKQRSGNCCLTTAAVAVALKLDESKVLSWESGTATPSFSQLTKLSKLYKRPTCVFYLPSPPRDFTIMRDFRSAVNANSGEFSPRLALAIRESRERSEWLSDHLKTLGESPLAFINSESVNSAKEMVALKLRRLLGVTMKEQAASTSYSEAFKFWRRKIESASVCVFAVQRVDIEEMRGFAIIDRYAPVIALNSRDSYAAKIFTMLHEFARILIGKEGISDYQLDIPRSQTRKIEDFCNSVAAEAAVPLSHLQAVLPTFRDKHLSGIPVLAKRYRVSELVIARRLFDIGEIKSDVYRQIWLISQSRKTQEEQRKQIPQQTQARSRVGPRFATSAISAFRSGTLDGADLAHMLKMRLSHLTKLEQMIARYDTGQSHLISR